MDPVTIASIAGTALSSLGGIFGSDPPKLKEIRTQHEKDWVNQLESRTRTGTLPVNQLQQIMGRTASQRNAINQANLANRMMRQGLGSSIVTQELMRRTDRDTLQYLADESRKISLANQMSKIKAQDQLGEYGMMRSNRLMNIAQANAQASAGGGGLMSGIGDMISGIAGVMPK